ncbi:MAG: DUF3416 domain-containing protein, partial [Lentisphaeraceae bacterium]|nr:DUF3416 domain-containing protein [Lentisphaeraceae bacterium]
MSAPVYNSILIQNVSPAVDGGLFPVKRRVGSAVTVSCEAFGHGHDPIKAILLYRCRGNKKWQERLMDCTNPGLDLFESSFKVEEVGFYEYSILGYVDHFENWRSDTCKKFAAGDDISSELLAGEKIFAECVSRAPQKSQKKFKKILTDFQSLKTYEEKVEKLLNEETLQAAVQYPKKTGVDIGFSQDFTVRVDRKKAEFASWYEMFPRSAGNVEGQSGTFKDVEKHLPYIAGMGFDVLYFTPIHPIGKTKRKGKNNSLVAEKNDPGSPYAIGDETGGHFAVHPELGTIDDFDALVEKCRESGIEIALDFALNCSPDHPYLNEKPDWFYRRPDGSIKFAENPPKKYEDIYPLNFECDDRKSLWQEI